MYKKRNDAEFFAVQVDESWLEEVPEIPLRKGIRLQCVLTRSGVEAKTTEDGGPFCSHINNLIFKWGDWIVVTPKGYLTGRSDEAFKEEFVEVPEQGNDLFEAYNKTIDTLEAMKINALRNIENQYSVSGLVDRIREINSVIKFCEEEMVEAA